jgi:hypothetical protein
MDIEPQTSILIRFTLSVVIPCYTSGQRESREDKG